MLQISADQFASLERSLGPTARCPLQPPPLLPCNLTSLLLTRTSSDEEGCAEADVAWRERPMDGLLQQHVSALVPLQVVAPSSREGNAGRVVTVRSALTGGCATHPQLYVTSASPELAGNTRTLTLFRQPAWDDRVDGSGAFVRLVRALFDQTVDRHEVAAYSCGVSSGGQRSAPSMTTAIEVYPADQFELMITLPLMGELFSTEQRAGGWNTAGFRAEQREEQAGREALAADQARIRQQDQAVREAGALADREFDAMTTPSRQVWGPKKQFRAFVEDITRAQQDRANRERGDATRGAVAAATSAQRRSDFIEQLSISFSVTDGEHTREVDCADLVRLYESIRTAERLVATLTSWINDLQVGVGAGVTCRVSLFELALGATWGYREVHHDRRVFMACEGIIEGNLIALEVEGEIGIKLASAADALITMSAKGALGLRGKVKRLAPEATAPAVTVQPTGTLEITGGLSGQAGFQLIALKREYTLAFAVNCDQAQMFGPRGFTGDVKIGHDGLTYDYSVSLAGFDLWSGAGESIIEARPDMLVWNLDTWRLQWNGFGWRP